MPPPPSPRPATAQNATNYAALSVIGVGGGGVKTTPLHTQKQLLPPSTRCRAVSATRTRGTRLYPPGRPVHPPALDTARLDLTPLPWQDTSAWFGWTSSPDTTGHARPIVGGQIARIGVDR